MNTVMKTKTIFYSLFCFLFISGGMFAQAWDGTTKTAWTVGDGLTAETAFEISTPAHLAYLAQEVNAGTTYESKFFKMTTNLDLGSQQWTRIGGATGTLTTTFPFKGTFDGQGFTVSNLYQVITGNSEDAKNIGLFGYVEGGVIKNLGIASGFVQGFTRVGGLVGTLNTGTVDNCYNKANIETAPASDRFGGLVGSMVNGTIRNSFNSGSLMAAKGTANNTIGGIVGISENGTIEFCFNVGSVTGNNGVGGIVASGGIANIRNCYNTGTIKGKQNFGGIVGIATNAADPAIEKCYSTGFMDISERKITGTAGTYGAVYGSSNTRIVNNSYYDTQLITNTSVLKGTPSLTSLMLGDGIRSSLGDDYWVYASGFYPALKNNKTSDAAILSISPLVMDEEDDVDGVVSNFTVETSTGVLWSSSDETGIDISGSNAMVLKKQADQNIIVTATYGSLSKSYNLFIPLDPSTAVNHMKNQLSVKLNGNVLSVHGDILYDSKLTVYDLTGSVVLSQKVSVNNTISLANLSKGVYVLAAVSSEGVSSSHKFIIQ
jgi:hypothetical protein